MKQAAVAAWIATLVPGDTAGVFADDQLLFKTKVIRRTDTGRVVCEPGGTFKKTGYPDGRLADESRQLRPVYDQQAVDHGHGKNAEGFGFVDVCGEAWKGHINLFWKDYPLALVPPPIAIEIRSALILARQNGDRTGARSISGYLDQIPAPAPAASVPLKRAQRQQVVVPSNAVRALKRAQQHELVPGKALLVANRGTPDELTITAQHDDSYQIDNVFGSRGKKWLEFPRTYKSVAACKASASRIVGEPQVWEAED